jgi:ATP-dependent RNA helicase DeaD
LKTFTELGINDTLTKALAEQGIIEPSIIQQKSIPVLLEKDKDLIGISQTGSGKTAAFGLPLLQKIDASINDIQALIICPTRELAQQTAKQLGLFSKYLDGVYIRAIFGGTEIEPQIRELRKPTQIIVSTPGRLIDLIDRNAIDLDHVIYFILDEADEMLKMGFKEPIDYIKSLLRPGLNTWMFCATMQSEVEQLKHQYLRSGYYEVKANADNTLNEDIEHQYLVCKPEEKREGLKFYLKQNSDKTGIVFCRTKAAVQEIADYLKRNGFSADEIHSDLSQKSRDNVMRRFKNNELKILVATDIAARGIDVKGLNYVIHYHLPEQREYFTHRSGRTGRAGNKGISLCIVFQKEVKKIKAIANNLGLQFTKVEFVYNSDDISEQTSSSNDSEEKVNEVKKEGVINVLPKPGDMVKFYINMGKANEVNNKNLVQFICAEANLKPADFGEITVEKKRAYFEVHYSCIQKLVKGLDNLEVDGKPLVLTRVDFEVDDK